MELTNVLEQAANRLARLYAAPMGIATGVKRAAWKLLPAPAAARAAYWKQYLWSGERELRQLPDITRGEGIAIDVGANVGYYSYALARLGHRVISFEPDTTYVLRLHALLGVKADIIGTALSSSAGQAVMRVPDVGGGRYGGTRGSLSDQAVPDEDISTSYAVQTRTLDSYGFHGVTFMKIDVEGHEEGVLTGAMATIARCQPTLLIEIEEQHNPGGLNRITEQLGQLGYSGQFFQGEWQPLSAFSPETHQAHTVAAGSNLRKADYINNFVFTPSGRSSL